MEQKGLFFELFLNEMLNCFNVRIEYISFNRVLLAVAGSPYQINFEEVVVEQFMNDPSQLLVSAT